MKPYFQLDRHIIHLNHAAVAPWPLVTRDAVIAFAKENAAIGSQHYDLWLKTEQQLKQKMCTLINADSTDEIALLKNTSEGLSLIAQGLHFIPGDNIVVPAEEFPSNRVVWQVLQSKGVEIRLVPVQDIAEPEQALHHAIDRNTRLLSCSTVQYAHGLMLDINLLGRICKQHDVLFCVDAIQSLGAIAFDVQRCQADFVVADGHKWMCGPEGTALFYCRREVQPLLELQQYGWHMLKHAFDFNRQQGEPLFADGAQRFECGSSNMLGIAALNASLGLLLEIGIENIQQQLLGKTEYLFRQLSALPEVRLLTPRDKGRYAGIVTFHRAGIDQLELYRHLQQHNVICACRGNGIRFSPHFYTDTQLLDNAIDFVRDFS